MACRRCGQCCNRATLILHHIRKGNDPLDFQHFLAFHHVETMWVEFDEGPEVLAVVLPLTCMHLSYDQETGFASCRIYEDRPEICRKHLCPAASEEEAEGPLQDPSP